MLTMWLPVVPDLYLPRLKFKKREREEVSPLGELAHGESIV